MPSHNELGGLRTVLNRTESQISLLGWKWADFFFSFSFSHLCSDSSKLEPTHSSRITGEFSAQDNRRVQLATVNATEQWKQHRSKQGSCRAELVWPLWQSACSVVACQALSSVSLLSQPKPFYEPHSDLTQTCSCEEGVTGSVMIKVVLLVQNSSSINESVLLWLSTLILGLVR